MAADEFGGDVTAEVIQTDLAPEEIEEIEEVDESLPNDSPVTAPPTGDEGAPLEPRDESDWEMPFETVDIATLPSEGAESLKSGTVPDPEPETGETWDEGQPDSEAPALEDGDPEPPNEDQTKSAPSATVSTAGVDDLMASILEKPESAPEAMPDQAFFPDRNESEIVQGAEPEEQDEAAPAEVESSTEEPGHAEVAVAATTEPVARIQAQVPFVLDDGDPFGGDGWDLAPVLEEPPAELLEASDDSDGEKAGASTPVDIAVQENSLALKLTGTGAIVESGQVRAIDIEVPVPGAWVGNHRVTMQLRLTLVPASEDEDA